MRRYLYTIIFSFCVIGFANAQNIVGLWQNNSSEISAGYMNIYRFYPDSTFLFEINQDDGLCRIRGIGGNYIKDKSRIVLIAKYTIEWIGGKLDRSYCLISNDSWEISGIKTKKVVFPSPIKEELTLDALEESEGVECIDIDGDKYYRINGNPNK